MKNRLFISFICCTTVAVLLLLLEGCGKKMSNVFEKEPLTGMLIFFFLLLHSLPTIGDSAQIKTQIEAGLLRESAV